MTTSNRRVAAYLPKEIDERLQAYKNEHGVSGDSQAIIAILTEFLGVSYSVTHEVAYSDFTDLTQRIEVLESQISSLRSELLSNLKSELLESGRSLESRLISLEGKLNTLQQTKEEVKGELLSELRSELPVGVVPGQLELIPETSKDAAVENVSGLSGEPSGSSRKDLLAPLNGYALSKRFGLGKNTVNSKRANSSPEEFTEWARKKDPSGIAWEYRQDERLYYPVSDS